MTVRLKPEVQSMIEQDVARGPYASVDEFVDRAVRMLHDQESWPADNRDEIEAKIEHGYAQAERGELVIYHQGRVTMDAPPPFLCD